SYGSRKKADVYWIAGARFFDSSLLNKITVLQTVGSVGGSAQGEIVREYRITYNNGVYESGADSVDRVVSIKGCLGEQCSRPLRLDWGFASPGSATKGNGKVKTYKGSIFAANDAVDKNGYPSEMIKGGYADNETWSVNNFSLSENANGYWYYSHQDADIDGDGRLDMLL